MESRSQTYLEMAYSAMCRGDYLCALQLGLHAAGAAHREEPARCDAYMLLALTSLEMGMMEDALSFAVGAHLAACWTGDEGREEKAASIVAVLTAHPELAQPPENQRFH